MRLPAICDSLDAVELGSRPLHMAVGMFDGVHLGHRTVIERAVQSARDSHGVSGVLTFSPHPSSILYPEKATRLIMPLDQKTQILIDLGVDLVIRKKFTREFAAIEAEEFPKLLRGALPTLSAIYVGEDYHFGRGRRGDVRLLIKEARKIGMSVFSSERIRHSGRYISSTRIREDLRTGRIEEVNAQLGYIYFSSGSILSGRQIGRKIGFPTINLTWMPELQPCYGVYAVRVSSQTDESWIAGVANYGVKPTVTGESEPLLEVHLLEDTGLVAGDAAIVKWYSFLRPEERFPNLAALKVQIEKDKKKAANILAKD